MHQHLIAISVLLCFAAVLPGSSAPPQPAAKLTPVTLILQWTPQSQFAGYYAAKDTGIYRKYGLDVRILPGGPDRNAVQYLQDGKAQFTTTFLTTAIVRRDQGIPLVNIAQVVNQSNLMLIAWKDRRIRTLQDLHGRPVSIWGGDFRSPYTGLFHTQGVRPTLLDQNYSVNLFLRHGVDACSAMYYNEYHMIYQAGVNKDEITTFFLRDYKCDVPEDGIYCLEQTLRRQPAVCEAFAKASLEGWRYADAHRDEAIKMVMKYVRDSHITTNASHMRWMLNAILPSIIPHRDKAWRLGELSPSNYATAVTMLKQQQLITSAPSYRTFVGKEAARVP